MSNITPMSTTTLMFVPIDQIRRSRWQYRRSFDEEKLLELAKSIEQHGLIMAPLVFRHEERGFELIAGERRVRACAALALVKHRSKTKLAGAIALAAAREWWDDAAAMLAGIDAPVRCEVRAGAADEFHSLAVVENLQRENPSPVEEAAAFEELMTANDWTQVALAHALGKSEGYVSQRLSLLELAEEVKEATHRGEISFAAARTIATAPAPIQAALAKAAHPEARGVPATSRELETLAKQARAFLNPERWQPAAGEVISPAHRNRYRLLQAAVEEAAMDETRAAVALDRMRERGDLGGQPGTISRKPYMTCKTLIRLTGLDRDAYRDLPLYWQEYADREDRHCTNCQWVTVMVPEGETSGVDALPCAQWAGQAVDTCPGWTGAEDPAVAFFPYDAAQRLMKEGGGTPPLQEAEGGYYVAGLEEARAAWSVALRARQAEQARETQRRESGWLETMRAYWAAQPLGLGGRFDLVHGQAHGCRFCRHFRPERGEPPCEYADQPLVDAWNKERRAPAYAVMVRQNGACVPRCERFHAVEVPTLEPVHGVSFPANGDRELVLEWLDRIVTTRESYNRNERHGALMGILTWLPYERDPGTVWDRKALVAYVREHWQECGGDRGVARLLSVASYEGQALESPGGVFRLMDPMTGKVEQWAAVGWEDWTAGSTSGRDYPDGWPRPWEGKAG